MKLGRKKLTTFGLVIILLCSITAHYLEKQNKKLALRETFENEGGVDQVDETFETQGRCYGTVRISKSGLIINNSRSKCNVDSYSTLYSWDPDTTTGGTTTTYLFKSKNKDCIYDSVGIRKTANTSSFAFEIAFHTPYFEDPMTNERFIDDTTYCAAVKI